MEGAAVPDGPRLALEWSDDQGAVRHVLPAEPPVGEPEYGEEAGPGEHRDDDPVAPSDGRRPPPSPEIVAGSGAHGRSSPLRNRHSRPALTLTVSKKASSR